VLVLRRGARASLIEVWIDEAERRARLFEASQREMVSGHQSCMTEATFKS
jgi:hypothetical protein